MTSHKEAMARAKTPSDAVLEQAAALGGFALGVCGLRHHFQDVCSARLKDVGITPAMMYFLLYVSRFPGCTQREMSDALCVDVGYSTRTVAKLEEAGLVERRPNPADGRSSLLRLTPAGEVAYAYGKRIVDEWEEEALGCLSAQEREQLTALLARVVAGLGSSLGSESAATG